MIRNRNRKFNISTASTKAKSQEPAYSQALVKRQWWVVLGVETGRDVGRRGENED